MSSGRDFSEDWLGMEGGYFRPVDSDIALLA